MALAVCAGQNQAVQAVARRFRAPRSVSRFARVVVMPAAVAGDLAGDPWLMSKLIAVKGTRAAFGEADATIARSVSPADFKAARQSQAAQP
jgi:hypothetical protein